MSKISYCSLEEAWGKSYTENNDNNNNDNNNLNKYINNTNSTPTINNQINNKIFNNKFDKLDKKGEEDRDIIISNMNLIERNKKPENNTLVEYDKYRFNPQNSINKNSYEKEYTPFQESIEKKYLQDKLNYLENEFRKYRNLFDEKNPSYSLENFSNNNDIQNMNNNNNNFNNSSNDIIDLIILIIIGLIVIFVLNSIFSLGKSIGARSK